MQAIRFHAHGGPEQLRVETIPTPAPAAHEVLLRIRAVSLNGFDPMVLRGIPGLPTPRPMIPCGDCAGEIVALGADVDATRWHIGDRVSVMPIMPGLGVMGETQPGVAAQFRTVPQSALLRLPDTVSDHQAACLPTAFGTAMRMLATRARLTRGERVLILGAAGGVGTACVQIARHLGAEVLACTDRPDAVPALRALGADDVIVSGDAGFATEVIRRAGKPSIWGGGGVDVVVDFLGGDTWAQSLACVGRGGRIVTCGASAGPAVTTDLRYVWSFEIEIIGSNGWTMQDQARVIDLVATGGITPLIHSVRPLSAYADALRDFMNRGVIGKSVLEP
ncbi:MAG: zinc-binding alcohol dehydrogenase family protein [Acetobacteraceae bacterium]